MAVYTEVSDEALSAFLQDFEIGHAISFKGIAEGVENSNYLLRTSVGSYILTLYEKRVDPDDLPFFIALMEHLSDRGIACPVPIKRRDGSALGELEGRPAAIISFLNGMSVRKPQVEHCREVGRALGAFHTAGQNFAGIRPNALGLKSWRPLLDQSRARGDEVFSGLVAQIDQEIDYLEANWPKDLPMGVIHADLFTDNVFFIEGRLSGVIDFYFACTDAFAYDVVICLNDWCFESDFQFNVTKARALLSGYQSTRTLSEVEVRALPILARGASVRFLLTRLYDYLAVPEGALVTPKDPREYLQKLRFHQMVESAVDYGLEPFETAAQ